MLGSLILYLNGMRIMMFQLSGFYCNCRNHLGTPEEPCGLLKAHFQPKQSRGQDHGEVATASDTPASQE